MILTFDNKFVSYVPKFGCSLFPKPIIVYGTIYQKDFFKLNTVEIQKSILYAVKSLLLTMYVFFVLFFMEFFFSVFVFVCYSNMTSLKRHTR